MRATDKLDLIDKIGRELQSRFAFNDLIPYLSAHGMPQPADDSRRVRHRRLVRPMRPSALRTTGGTRGNFRLFISHISAHKDAGGSHYHPVTADRTSD